MQPPGRQSPSIGIHSHVRYNWGIYAQPIVLNERQGGAAIDGVVRDERLETSQLPVDTHGYGDVAMTLARLLGFALCPRLQALKDRHLFVPRGTEVPDTILSICHVQIDFRKFLVHGGTRRSTAMPPELIGRIAPTRTERINLRGVFRFPIDVYADRLLPSLTARQSAASGR